MMRSGPAPIEKELLNQYTKANINQYVIYILHHYTYASRDTYIFIIIENNFVCAVLNELHHYSNFRSDTPNYLSDWINTAT